MKKIILFLGALIVASGAFAQASLSVKAAATLNNHLSNDSSKVKFGFKAGVGVDMMFNDLIGLQPSLLVSNKGAKLVDYEGSLLGADTRADMTINQLYLELPVMLTFMIPLGAETGLVLSVGPYFAYGIGGKTKLSGSIGDFSGSTEWNTFSNDDNGMKRFDMGGGVGVAFDFGRFFVGIDTEMGFMKLYDNGDDDNRNISASLGLGFRF